MSLAYCFVLQFILAISETPQEYVILNRIYSIEGSVKSTLKCSPCISCEEILSDFHHIPIDEQILKLKIIDVMRRTFEIYGYNPIDTPVLERYDVLASKYAGGSEI
ncbi:MAG: hypothetical protein HGA25_09160, partial [Clostridiales bacterium]|nr:hypothetical protein [Clostridiales bacterium]